MLAENHLFFWMSMKFDLIRVWVVQIDFNSVRGIEYGLIWVWGWNWFCCVGGRNLLGFWTRGENHLFLVSACKLTWILCGWFKLTWVQCGGSNLTWFQCTTKMTLFQCGGSALVLFLCSCRKQLTSVRIDISWVSVSGHQNRFDTRVGIKIDWFQWWGQSNSVLTRWIEIDLVLASGSNFTCFLSGGYNRLRFCVWADNFLDLIYGSKIDLVLAWGSQLTWFLCAGRRRLVFSVGMDWLSFCAGGWNWLGICALAENHLVLV